jgi:NitT/TauT family transport system substrate-binding protein
MRLRRSRFAALAAAATAAPRIVVAQDLPLLRLVTVTNDTVTAALYAQRAGLFRAAGLNVDLQPANSGAAASAAVAGGAAELGFSSLVTLIEAHVRGVPFTLVAPAGQYTSDVPYAVFIVRKDSPVRTARDFNGKLMAVQALKDLNTMAMLQWMDVNGGDSKSVRFVELPLAAFAAAIVEGRVDGGNIGTPYLTLALDDERIRTLAQIFDAIAKRFLIGAYFANADFVAKNRDAVERFSRTIHDASVYCNAHHADTVSMVAAFSKVDEKVVARMTRVTFPDYLAARDIQPLVDTAYKFKSIDRTFDAGELISSSAAKPR